MDSSIPAPVAIADTEPPPAVLPQIGSSVPAGTFRNSDPATPRRKRSEPQSDFLNATRYSLPPRPPEVLGRPSARSKGSRRPAGTGHSTPPMYHEPATTWKTRARARQAGNRLATRAPRRPSTQHRRSVPPDPRRDNDGSAMTHDVVSLGPNAANLRAAQRRKRAGRTKVGSCASAHSARRLASERHRRRPAMTSSSWFAALRDAGPEDENGDPPVAGSRRGGAAGPGSRVFQASSGLIATSLTRGSPRAGMCHRLQERSSPLGSARSPYLIPAPR